MQTQQQLQEQLQNQYKSLEKTNNALTEQLTAANTKLLQLTEQACVPVIDVETGATSATLPVTARGNNKNERPHGNVCIGVAAENQQNQVNQQRCWMKDQVETQGRLKQMKKEKSEVQNRLCDADNRFDDRVLCVVCQEEEREVLTLPCSHVGLCRGCADQMAKCPTCQTTIDQKLRMRLI
jgi:hypothetical protein